MTRTLLFLSLLLTTSFGMAQVPKNVEIINSTAGSYPPCEPSIAVNPEDPSQVVAGAVLDYVITSADSGKTWKTDRLTSRYGVYGDPCIIPGEKGRFFYFHLSNPSGLGWAGDDILDRIVCQRLTKWGGQWDQGWGMGLNSSKDQDKEWGVWDPINRRLVVTWTQFDVYGDEDPSCESNIMLSTSKKGKKWTEAIDISSVPGNCIDNSGTNEGAVPAIFTDGSVCVAWALDGNIYFKRMLTGKAGVMTVLEENIAVEGGADWAFDIPGLGRANGMPITLVDLSGGTNHGNIYINWADQRNGEDDTDVWVITSTDGGATWSDPTRVNDDPPGKQQFFTWMAVDQSTGHLHCVFYDRRNHSDHATDVVVAHSKDGGKTWNNQIVSESSFTPTRRRLFWGLQQHFSSTRSRSSDLDPL